MQAGAVEEGIPSTFDDVAQELRHEELLLLHNLALWTRVHQLELWLQPLDAHALVPDSKSASVDLQTKLLLQQLGALCGRESLPELEGFFR